MSDRKLAAHMATFSAFAIIEALHSMEQAANANLPYSEWKHWAELLQSRLAALQKNIATAYPEQFKGDEQ